MKSTICVYERIYQAMDKSDPVGWLRDEIAQRQPLGTLLPKRAVVKHFLMAKKGMDEEVVDSMLPKLRGRKGKKRTGLTEKQFRLYLTVCERVPDPSKTILKLLPHTGLRISEMSTLTFKNLDQVENRIVFRFRGKGDKERIVPLSKEAHHIFTDYLIRNGYVLEDGTGLMDSGFIFENSIGNAISPAAVRKHTRKMGSDHKELKGISPHILRHTFATRLNRAGCDIKTLQELLGHKDVSTTVRYLHPSTADLITAIDKL